MFLDAQLQFSDAQAITAAAGSTHTIDTSVVRDLGTGRDLYVGVTIDVAFTDGSSDSTLTVSLEGDSTTTFSPDGTRDLMIIPALAALGTKYFAKLSPSIGATDPLAFQYIRLKYTPNNGNLTTGTVTAAIYLDIDKVTNFADSITIS